MDRRDFLTNKTLVNTVNTDNTSASMVPVSLNFNTYSGQWTSVQARHLLSRTLFGMKKADIDKSVKLGLSATLDQLFRPITTPNPPVTYNAQDSAIVSGAIKAGETFVNQPLDPNNEFQRDLDIENWWWDLILSQDFSIQEKMVFFWHNHFVTETQTVKDSRYLYRYYQLLRNESLGNFKTLTEKITIDLAMLVYLNGDQNNVKAPNENFGRELLELFTIGKGEQIAPGNYTNYTEDDIKAAAKVLTGWTTDRTNLQPIFKTNAHDKTTKTFTSAFKNTKIVNNNEKEYLDLISMIFSQDETSKFICRKFYRFFVNFDINSDIENNIIIPMAQMLRDNNFQITPVLRALLSSEHFYDVNLIGCIIKNPIDFWGGIVHNFEIPLDKSNMQKYLKSMNDYFYNYSAAIGLYLGDPPNVAGYQAYYQIPSFYQMWINSVTLTYRNQITDGISSGGLKSTNRDIALIPDFKLLITKFSNPNDPNIVIKDFANLLMPVTLTDNQLAALKPNIVDSGQGDYNWTDLWIKYVNNPNDAVNNNTLNIRLYKLAKAMTAMAEYQLM